MTEQISVYAEAVVARADGNSQFVTLDKINPSQVLGEFSDIEKLESVDFQAVVDYVTKVQESSDE